MKKLSSIFNFKSIIEGLDSVVSSREPFVFDSDQISNIPEDIWYMIVLFLPISNYPKLMRINRGWYEFIDGENNWKNVYEATLAKYFVSKKHSSDPRFWKNTVKSLCGWSTFNPKHKAEGLELSNSNKTVTSAGNRSFAPIISNKTLPMKGTVSIEFSMDYITGGGYTGIGIATEDVIFPDSDHRNLEHLPALSQGYIGQYRSGTSDINKLTNIGYFENGYMSTNTSCGESSFTKNYGTGDAIKMVVNLDKPMGINFGWLTFFKNGEKIGHEYKGIRQVNQSLYIVINMEGRNGVKVTVTNTELSEGDK
jgi:hypothetical protein